MAEAVSPDERITRFLTQSGHFRPGQNRVDYSAYMPARNGTTSVYRTSTLDDDTIRAIAKTYVEPHRGPARGRGDAFVRAALDAGLRVESDPSPHPLHANIVGWNGDRAADRIAAQKIADRASLVLY